MRGGLANEEAEGKVGSHRHWPRRSLRGAVAAVGGEGGARAGQQGRLGFLPRRESTRFYLRRGLCEPSGWIGRCTSYLLNIFPLKALSLCLLPILSQPTYFYLRPCSFIELYNSVMKIQYYYVTLFFFQFTPLNLPKNGHGG